MLILRNCVESHLFPFSSRVYVRVEVKMKQFGHFGQSNRGAKSFPEELNSFEKRCGERAFKKRDRIERVSESCPSHVKDWRSIFMGPPRPGVL